MVEASDALTVSEALSRAGWMDLQLADGSVISVHPSVIAQKREEEQRQRLAFFEGLYKAVQPNADISPGTVFRSGYQSQATSAWRTLEKPRDTPNFIFLRAMRRQSMIDQLIIDIRLEQVRNVARYSPNPRRHAGWRVRHKLADDPSFAITDDIKRRCFEMERRIETGLNEAWHPFGLDSAIIQLTEDELVIDRKALIYDAIDSQGRWHGGFHFLDPASVKPRIDAILPEIERMAVEQAVPMRQLIERQQWVNEATYRASEKSNVDLTDKAYVQEVDGQIVSAWTADECKVDVIHTTSELNRWGYGRSPLESAMWWSLSFMLAANFNTDLFRQNYPEAVMFLFGDVDPIGLDQFKKQVLLDNAAGANWRLPVIPAGEGMKAQIEKLRDAPREMMFAQWLKMLTSFKCACYRMNPELLNFDLVHGNDQTLFETASNEARVILAKEEGFNSILQSIGAFFTRTLVRPWYDDLVFEWVGLDAMTEREEVKMRLDQLMYSTLGEVREESGVLRELDGPDKDLSDRILNPTAVAMRHQEAQVRLQRQQLELQRKQMEAQAAQPSKNNAPGTPRKPPGVAGTEDPPSAGGRLHRNPPMGGQHPTSQTERADRE
jgi:hypothetical protein